MGVSAPRPVGTGTPQVVAVSPLVMPQIRPLLNVVRPSGRLQYQTRAVPSDGYRVTRAPPDAFIEIRSPPSTVASMNPSAWWRFLWQVASSSEKPERRVSSRSRPTSTLVSVAMGVIPVLGSGISRSGGSTLLTPENFSNVSIG